MKYLKASVFLLLIVGIITASCSTTYKSNGERIYFTATSSSGTPIFSEGFTMMHGRIACVNCHGSDGRGGVVNIMMANFEAPNITWAELTGPHASHDPYNEETVKDAITLGLEPNGEALEIYMPRWQISDQDLDDLIDFLKTLK